MDTMSLMLLMDCPTGAPADGTRPSVLQLFEQLYSLDDCCETDKESQWRQTDRLQQADRQRRHETHETDRPRAKTC